MDRCMGGELRAALGRIVPCRSPLPWSNGGAEIFVCGVTEGATGAERSGRSRTVASGFGGGGGALAVPWSVLAPDCEGCTVPPWPGSLRKSSLEIVCCSVAPARL